MRIALVTGPGSGIGAVALIELAKRGYHVVAAGRFQDRIRPVIEAVEASGGTGEYLRLDLSSLRSVREAAATVIERGHDLDVLVNNAGIGINRRGLTEDGFEVHFGINHLGHFLLTLELLGALRPGSRVVTLASAIHHQAERMDFERVRRPTRFIGLAEYSMSKLANVLFSRELARRVPEVDSYAVHPGLVATRLIPGVYRWLAGSRMKSPEQGADTVVWCATEPALSGQTGLYYQDRTPTPPSPLSRDDALAAELWERSEQWVGMHPSGDRAL